MKLPFLIVLFLGLLTTHLEAQTLEGRWGATLRMPDGMLLEISTVITGNTYITNSMAMQQTTMGTFPYVASQSGEVMFTPPDNLRLIVLDWSPKSSGGFPVHMPPNGNYTIVSLTQQQLTVIDNLCTASAPVAQCTFTFYRY